MVGGIGEKRYGSMELLQYCVLNHTTGGFETEGIFRISGSLASIKKLKEAVEESMQTGKEKVIL
jgi:hypothetical protein